MLSITTVEEFTRWTTVSLSCSTALDRCLAEMFLVPCLKPGQASSFQNLAGGGVLLLNSAAGRPLSNACGAFTEDNVQSQRFTLTGWPANTQKMASRNVTGYDENLTQDQSLCVSVSGMYVCLTLRGFPTVSVCGWLCEQTYKCIHLQLSNLLIIILFLNKHFNSHLFPYSTKCRKKYLFLYSLVFKSLKKFKHVLKIKLLQQPEVCNTVVLTGHSTRNLLFTFLDDLE